MEFSIWACRLLLVWTREGDDGDGKNGGDEYANAPQMAGGDALDSSLWCGVYIGGYYSSSIFGDDRNLAHWRVGFHLRFGFGDRCLLPVRGDQRDERPAHLDNHKKGSKGGFPLPHSVAGGYVWLDLSPDVPLQEPHPTHNSHVGVVVRDAAGDGGRIHFSSADELPLD